MNRRLWILFLLLTIATVVVTSIVFAIVYFFAGDLNPGEIAIGIAISSVISGLISIQFFNRIIAHPIDTLSDGMRRVANGLFDTHLEEDKGGRLLKGTFRNFNQMTESLLGVEALRESFVSNVAHEFKTPLSYIQGYATLLQDDDLTADDRRDYVGHINTATRRLSNMIGNLLEISNLSRPNARPEMARFSLDEQLRHTIAIFIPQMNRKAISYEIGLQAVDIIGNESLLEDAWTNLISNAVKYTPTGGLISIDLKQSRDFAEVTISDTGCGMSKEQVSHAFDRFYQGDDSHTSEGNGLGLAIVKAVIKKHNGSIDLESAPGEGACFSITLPKDETPSN